MLVNLKLKASYHFLADPKIPQKLYYILKLNDMFVSQCIVPPSHHPSACSKAEFAIFDPNAKYLHTQVGISPALHR